MKMGYGKGFFYGVMIAGIIAIVAVVFAWVFMYLWNWLVPELFNGPVLTFWQALGLLILSKMIFGGIGTRNKHSGFSDKWKNKCSNLSDEDRDRWKSHFMNKWNCGENKETTSDENSSNDDPIDSK